MSFVFDSGQFALSHTRTVVRECCKHDDQSQLERPKFDPPSPLNPLTDCHKNLPTWLHRGCLPSCKISCRSYFPHQIVYSVIFVCFLGGSSSRLQPRRPDGFWRKIRQKTQFRTRMCILSSQKQKFSFSPLFAQKTAILRPFFDARKRL